MYRRALLIALMVCSLLSTSFAETVLIEVDDTKDGQFIVTVKNKVVSSRPIKQLIKLNQSSTPTTPPPDTEPTTPPTTNKEFITQIKTETQTVLTNGGTKTSGAAIASVYSLVGDKVAKGEIALDKWQKAISEATDAVFIIQTDKDKWATFRQRLGASLTAIQSKGLLDSQDEVSQVLKDVATGMNQATGFSATRHLDKNARTEKGILDGIDIEQIMRLIELILKLLEAFK